MSWTWRRTATVLLIASALGLTSVGVFIVGAQQCKQIVDSGRSVQAVITADHDGEIDHWYTVRYTAQGESRSANLRAPWLIDKMSVGQVLTVYVDANRPERIVTANGYATPVWTPAPGWLMVLAMLAAFIAIVGWLSGSRRRRSNSGVRQVTWLRGCVTSSVAHSADRIEDARLFEAQGARLGVIATKTGIPETSLHRYLAAAGPVAAPN